MCIDSHTWLGVAVGFNGMWQPSECNGGNGKGTAAGEGVAGRRTNKGGRGGQGGTHIKRVSEPDASPRCRGRRGFRCQGHDMNWGTETGALNSWGLKSMKRGMRSRVQGCPGRVRRPATAMLPADTPPKGAGALLVARAKACGATSHGVGQAGAALSEHQPSLFQHCLHLPVDGNQGCQLAVAEQLWGGAGGAAHERPAAWAQWRQERG